MELNISQENIDRANDGEEDGIDADFFNDGLIFANEEKDLILSEDKTDNHDTTS